MVQFKALFVIFCLSLTVFWLARRPITDFAIDTEDFKRRRNLWFAVTLLAFAAHNFWIYIFGAGLLVVFGAQREPNRLAMFLALLMAVPSFAETIPGIGGIQQLMTLSHVRMLSIVLLLPAFLAIRRRPGVMPFGRTAADKCLIGYLVLQSALQFAAVSMTANARLAIYSVIDVFLPYYVASRGLRELREYRDTLATFALAMVLMAPVAIFEYFRHWLLYSELSGHMGVYTPMSSYMSRAGSIRAVVTAEHSIALGYLVVVAIGCFVYVQRFIVSTAIKALAIGLLVFMLIAAGARGPWLGAVCVLVVMLLNGPDKLNRTIKAILISIPALVALSFTEFGKRLVDVLPFVGTDLDSLDYRQRLFDISVPVILQHPWFGAFDYLVNPAMQELIQGEGIIDVVNTFLGVALTFGGVGLTLFCGVFFFSGWNIWNAFRITAADSEAHLLGRSLFATMVAILVTIFSVSSISVIPWIYWIFAGLCVGYAQMVRELGHEESATTQLQMPGFPQPR